MPFREDDEATRARVDALAEEVAELKAERDALLAERAAKADAERESAKESAPAPLEKPKKKREKPEKSGKPAPAVDVSGRADRQANLVGWIVGGVCGLVLIGAIVTGVLAGRKRNLERERYNAAVKQRKAVTERWQALVGTEPCARMARVSAWYARDAMQREVRSAPHDASAFVRGLQINCTDGAAALRADPSTDPSVKGALGAWVDTEQAVSARAKPLSQYLSDGDWKEDDFRGVGALWEGPDGVKPALDRRDVALDAVRRDALPRLREEIRGKGVAHEKVHGRDAIAWRVELGLVQWDMEDAALRVLDSPADAAASKALHDTVARLLEATGQAPIEVRRDVRRMDYLTGAVMAGQVPRGDNLWNIIRPDIDLLAQMRESIPDLPPPPGPAPPPDDD